MDSSITFSSDFTVEGKPYIEIPSYIVFVVDGVEIGTVSATLDCSSLPDDYYDQALQAVFSVSRSHRIHMVSHERMAEARRDLAEREREPVRRSWWRRLFGLD